MVTSKETTWTPLGDKLRQLGDHLETAAWTTLKHHLEQLGILCTALGTALFTLGTHGDYFVPIFGGFGQDI